MGREAFLMKKKIFGGIVAVAVAGGLALAAPAGPAHADGYFDVCGSGYGVEGGSTSCAFAYNVYRAASGQNPVYAYSPVTDKVYQMECGPTQLTGPGLYGPAARCVGGNNAVVIVW
jgi:hypothetical protein